MRNVTVYGRQTQPKRGATQISEAAFRWIQSLGIRQLAMALDACAFAADRNGLNDVAKMIVACARGIRCVNRG